ncbi:MAG: response regulator transcription factor [Ilumatobacteraceae bacterium]
MRVYLVDDHALFRAGVRAEIGESVDVIGEAGTVDDAVRGIVSMRPDVAVVDVHLPDGGGRTIIERVLAAWPDAVFLALSVSDSAEDVVAVIRAGARGYVTKTIDAPGLVDAIRRVADGDAVFSPRLAGFVLDAFSGHLPAPSDPDLDLLTGREQEVMRLIARGYTYREVASRLHLSVKTIETHVSAVLRKLQLSNLPRAHRMGGRPTAAVVAAEPVGGGRALDRSERVANGSTVRSTAPDDAWR